MSLNKVPESGAVIINAEDNVHLYAERYSYQLGVFYVDFICECEKLADYVINIVETEE